MKFNSELSVFVSEEKEILTSEMLIELEGKFSKTFPNFELSQSYWDVSLTY